MLPGQSGSSKPAGADWFVQELRAMRQEIAQLRGQLSKARTAARVVSVTVTGTTTKTVNVTYANGTTQSYPL